MVKSWSVCARSDDAQRVTDAFKIHPVVADILLRRGFHSEAEIFSFLNPSLDCLEDPFVFHDMKKAVQRIHRAIASKEKILIYGDYDVDGVTASAILYPILKKMGAQIQVYIPHRVKDGYGLNIAALKGWVDQKMTLVITVDNGITGIEPVRYLKENGVDAILVDHHIPKEELPPAYAIISAAVNDRKGDSNLAACGLAFKLAWALLGSFEMVKEHLDLVALGTVADIAPVLGDNRILLRLGLGELAQTKKVGLRALMDSAGIVAQRVSYRDLAFGLGPRVNASGRMGTPLNAFRLLTTDNSIEARNLSLILEEGNRDRQRVEQQAFQEAAGLVERLVNPAHRKVLVVESPDWHEGVLGIVAARLVDRFKRPSIVISIKEGVGKGSGRSIPSFSIFDTVIQCEDLLMSFGGHSQACGLTIRQESLALFRDRVNGAAEGLDENPLSIARSVDAELLPDELTLKFVKDLERLAPFGPGNPAPLFLSRGLKLRGDVRKRGKDTLQCWMSNKEETVTCEVIGFRCYEEWRKSTLAQTYFEVAYRPALKNFNGIETIQLELESWN